MVDYKNMSLLEVTQLDGVKDLPLVVRGKFGQALQREAEGNHSVAERLLSQAIEKEQAS